MSRANQAFDPGTIVDGKYRVDRLIGSGGMGRVYEATQMAIGRKVALKTLRQRYVEQENAVLRFQQEARLAGSIGHEHICEVTDLGTHQNSVPYLVMPLLSGCTLGELTRKEKLSIPEILDMICQLLSAMEAAHAHGIVHRDLKPSNIFVCRAHRLEHFIKIFDFGISKVLRSEAADQITQTGFSPGTPAYMSPEQAKGVKQIDHRVDVYAIGVILYELLTGKLPFEGDSHNEVLYKILTAPFLSPRKLNPAVTLGLEAIVVKSMSRNPLNRFRDAREMRLTIEDLLQEEYGISLKISDTENRAQSGTDPQLSAPTMPTEQQPTEQGTDGFSIEGTDNSWDAVPNEDSEDSSAFTPPSRPRKARILRSGIIAGAVLLTALLAYVWFENSLKTRATTDDTVTSPPDSPEVIKPAIASAVVQENTTLVVDAGNDTELLDSSGLTGHNENSTQPNGTPPIPNTPNSIKSSLSKDSQLSIKDALRVRKGPKKKKTDVPNNKRTIKGRHGAKVFLNYD